MPIRRTYVCNDCEQEFTVECNADDPDPVCPNPDCHKVLDWRPQRFAIGGSNEGKAAKLAQDMLEKDYGLSNFRDNAKEGENSILAHHETKQEAELVEREFREQVAQLSPEKTAQFWGGNAGAPTDMTSMTGQSLIQMAKVGPQGPNPMTAFHNQAVKGKLSGKPQSMVSEGYSSPMDNPARKA